MYPENTVMGSSTPSTSSGTSSSSSSSSSPPSLIGGIPFWRGCTIINSFDVSCTGKKHPARGHCVQDSQHIVMTVTAQAARRRKPVQHTIMPFSFSNSSGEFMWGKRDGSIWLKPAHLHSALSVGGGTHRPQKTSASLHRQPSIEERNSLRS